MSTEQLLKAVTTATRERPSRARQRQGGFMSPARLRVPATALGGLAALTLRPARRAGCGMCAGVTLLAIAALTPAPAGASAKVLELTSRGKQVTPGQVVRLFTGQATFETPHGAVSCEEGSSLAAVDMTNKEATDKLKVNEQLGIFHEGHCSSTTGMGSAVVAFHVPEVRLSAKLKAELSSSATERVSLTLYFPTTEVACEYAAPKLKGKLALQQSPGLPISVKFTKAKLKLAAAGSPLCPKTVAATTSLSGYSSTFEEALEGEVLG